MPQKTIYVREEDQQLFEEAEEMINKELLSEDSLSSVIATSLRRYIHEEREKMRGMQKLRLKVGSRKSPSTLRYIQFVGKKLAEHSSEEKNGETKVYALYQSTKGNFLLYTSWYKTKENAEEAQYSVHSILEEIDAPLELITKAKSHLASGPVVFLDI